MLATCRHLPSAHAERQPFLERVRAGFDHVRSHRLTRLLVGGEALALVFFTLIVPIEVVYAEETLRTDEAGYGLLLSAWGAGVVLGSLVFLAVRRWSAFTLILLSTSRSAWPTSGCRCRASFRWRAPSPCWAGWGTACSG